MKQITSKKYLGTDQVSQVSDNSLNLILEAKIDMKFSLRMCHFERGPPRGKHDGVIGHNTMREFVNWTEKWRYCVIWYPWRDRENSIIQARKREN